jgi:excisionase family DNA binding protein
MNAPLAISIKDAALALSLSPWTIRKWISKGILPSIRLGRRVLLEPQQLEKLIVQNRRKPYAGTNSVQNN